MRFALETNDPLSKAPRLTSCSAKTLAGQDAEHGCLFIGFAALGTGRCTTSLLPEASV